jgi:hypothetical protein
MQFLVETDVLREYLTAASGEETLLRKALAKGVCYTTMYNALELFRAAGSKEESDAVMQMLMVVRVLGFNARYAQNFSDAALAVEKKTGASITNREAMMIGMAKISKLNILTKDFFQRYKALEGVPVVHSAEEVPEG